MIRRFFSPKNEISKPMEVTHALHLDKDLQWQFDPGFDAKDVFQKLQVIGKGGFGTVCKVLHIPSQLVLAGKLVNPNLVDNPNTRSEIEHEIQLMHEVDSAYTVHYYGSVQYEKSMMILMEYCDCGSLRDILDVREQVLTEDQISIVMHDLLQGLQLIHTRFRIVHRDIKAANILLTSSGEIKIADFGVSRRFEKTGTIHTVTIVGTPYWMAPEVINGTSYSFSADLWSVGITAVELSEGAPPYVELAPTKAMLEIVTKGFPGYRFNGMHSAEFKDFVSHCCVTDEHSRWTIQQLLQHPFIKKAENMNRKEVLADIIRAGPKAALQGNRETNNSMLSFATGRFSTNQNLQQARQMPMGAGDTFGSMAMPFSTDGSTGSFDTFSTNGFNPNQRQGNFNMNSANLNSATNFDTFGGGNFDTFGQKSAFGNFDSAALNSATNFDQFNSGFGQFASNGFDSASLNSATNFDSFVNSRNAQLQAQQGKQQQQQGNFDSFAISGFQDMPSSFDSFANDSFAGAPQKQLSPNDAFSSASNFDSFKSPMSFDSFEAGNSGVGFDTFSEELNKAKQQQQQQQQQPQQKQFVSPGGADLASARGFDTFGGGGNGFDSFAAGSNGFDSFAAGASGFDSFAGNGFDSAALNTGAGFDTFSENLNKAKEQQPQQQPPQQKQFVSPGGADLASAKGFDSFQGGGLDSFKGGFDSFKGSNGFDSFAAGSNGFDSFAGNGFDSAALNSGAGFDTFSENLNKAKNESNDQQKNFVSPKEADLASSNGLDSFALNSGSNFAKPGELNPSANFDSFAGGFNSPVDLNSGNFVKMNGNFDSGAFPSFDSFVASQSPLSNADLQPQPQQPTQQQEPPKAEQEPPKVEQNPEPKQEPPKPQEKSQPQQPVQQAQQQQQQPAERSHSPPPQPGQQGQPQMIIMQEQPKTQSQLSPQQIQMMRQAQMQKQQIIMQKQQQIASLNRIQQMQLMQQQQALQQQSIPGKPPLPPVNRRPAPDMPYQQMNRQGPGTVHAPQPRMQFTPGVYQKDEPSQQQQQVEKIEGPPTYSPSPYFIGFLVTILILLGPEGFVAVGAFIIALVLVLSFGKRDKDHAGLSPKRF